VKRALVTGGFGFLGRATARRFRSAGYDVIGIGNGRWTQEEYEQQGFSSWLSAPVTTAALMTLDAAFDVIVHCAGNGSVGYSQNHPRQDFAKTVESSAELLEYMRLRNASARLIYPSSAGVYGAREDAPIRESDPTNPVSTYGYHKRMVEQLCEHHSRMYGFQVDVARFFSIYGAGLTKQLLWDASVRMCSTEGDAEFWGTGAETRDWIHVDDATNLLLALASSPPAGIRIVNGGGGRRVTVQQALELLRAELNVKANIVFNGRSRPGDPQFYLADTARLRQLGIEPGVGLEVGLAEYARWFRSAWPS
jgi:UDP-glucose 4-epimerase